MTPRSPRPASSSPVAVALALAAGLVGCNDYGLFGRNDPGAIVSNLGESQNESDTAVMLGCPAMEPLIGTAAIDESCDAELKTGPLLTTVEWNRNDFGPP